MVPITMIRLPSYVSHDYSYMPVYTWIDTGGTIEYAYTLYHIPVSEAWGERIARFYRGWKYASHHKRMHLQGACDSDGVSEARACSCALNVAIDVCLALTRGLEAPCAAEKGGEWL
jgi:hypothetical protein